MQKNGKWDAAMIITTRPIFITTSRRWRQILTFAFRQTVHPMRVPGREFAAV